MVLFPNDNPQKGEGRQEQDRLDYLRRLQEEFDRLKAREVLALERQRKAAAALAELERKQRQRRHRDQN